MINVVLANDTSPNTHHGCRCVVDVIDEVCGHHSARITHRVYVNENWDKPNTRLAVGRAKLLLINGEGTIHHAAQKGLELLKLAEFAKSEGVRVVLFNATWQENPPEFFQLLKYVDNIFVRDSLSQGQLKSEGIEAEVVPDLTFYEGYKKSNADIRSRIAVTDSVYNELSLALYGLSLQEGMGFYPVIYSGSGILGRLKFYFGGFGIKNIPRNISGYLKYIIYKIRILKSTSRDRDDYLRAISSSKVLICARFHTLCFAIKLGIPFLIIDSNSHKIKGMLQDAGVKDIDRYFLSKGDFLSMNSSQVSALACGSALNTESLNSYASSARETIEAMFLKIFSSLGK